MAPATHAPDAGSEGRADARLKLSVLERRIRVKTADQLLAAIGSNRTILLEPKTYHLPAVQPKNAHVRLESRNGVPQLVVVGVKNLTLRSAGPKPARLLTNERYADVLTFRDVERVHLARLALAHAAAGPCTGGVLVFADSRRITLERVDLSGSGSEGLTLRNVEQLTFRDSTIRDCTSHVVTLHRAKKIRFVRAKFHDNGRQDLFRLRASSDVLFSRCQISGNKTYGGFHATAALFDVRHSNKVVVADSRVRNNQAQYLERVKGSVQLRRTVLAGNTFRKGRFPRPTATRLKVTTFTPARPTGAAVTRASLVAQVKRRAKRVIKVRTTAQLKRAIGSDRVIELAPGTYNLSPPARSRKNIPVRRIRPGPGRGHPHVSFTGGQLTIKGVRNLALLGKGRKRVKIVIADQYANVLVFRRVKNVALVNIEAGHAPKKGYCTGGVLVFNNAEKVAIVDSVLFGSGTEGLTLSRVKGLTFFRSVIRGCSYGIATMTFAENVRFIRSRLLNNEEFDLLTIRGSKNVVFDRCRLANNRASRRNAIFKLVSSQPVVVQNTRIERNNAGYLAAGTGELRLGGVTLGRNTFRHGKYR